MFKILLISMFLLLNACASTPKEVATAVGQTIYDVGKNDEEKKSCIQQNRIDCDLNK